MNGQARTTRRKTSRERRRRAAGNANSEGAGGETISVQRSIGFAVDHSSMDTNLTDARLQGPRIITACGAAGKGTRGAAFDGNFAGPLHCNHKRRTLCLR